MSLRDFGLMTDELLLQGIDHCDFVPMQGVEVMPTGHGLERFKTVARQQLAKIAFTALNPEDASCRHQAALLHKQGVVSNRAGLFGHDAASASTR